MLHGEVLPDALELLACVLVVPLLVRVRARARVRVRVRVSRVVALLPHSASPQCVQSQRVQP